MKQPRLPSIVLGLAVAMTLSACQKPAADEAADTTAADTTATAANRAATPADGEKLERQMWTYMKNKDSAALAAHVSDSFQSAHTDGPRDKAGELALMAGLNLGAYTLSDFKVTTGGDEMVVTYWITVPETIAGARQDAHAMRLSVWSNSAAGWQWIAHANLATVK